MNCCPTGKHSYLSLTAAWRVIQFLTRKAALRTHKQPGRFVGHAYRCPKCGQWHMTQKDEASRREPLKARAWQWQWHEEVS